MKLTSCKLARVENFVYANYESLQRATAWDMLKVYRNFIEAQEKRRYVLV